MATSTPSQPDGPGPRCRCVAAPPQLRRDRPFAAWSEDAAKRTEIIERIWTSDAQLVDPQLEGEGHAGVNDMAAALQTHFPGHEFRRTSGVDAHHNSLRVAWELVAPDGTVALTGLDVGEVDDDGRLRRITGFFGELAADDRS